jgi:hypothetical protein
MRSSKGLDTRPLRGRQGAGRQELARQVRGRQAAGRQEHARARQTRADKSLKGRHEAVTSLLRADKSRQKAVKG